MEALETLGISRVTVYTLIHRDDFPSIRIGVYPYRRLPEDSMKLELIGEIDNLINKYSEVLDLALMGFPKTMAMR